MKVSEKVLAKLSDLCDRIDEKVSDEDTQRIAKTVHKIFAALQRLAVKVPGLEPYRYLIDLVIVLSTCLEDDGDFNKEDLKNLAANYQVVVAAAKSLRNI